MIRAARARLGVAPLRLARSDVTQSMAIKMVGAALSFLVTLMIARVYGAAVSGEYALAVQTVLTASAIALFGNDQLLIRRMAGERRIGRMDLANAALRHAVRLVGIASAVAALLLILASPLAPRIGTSWPVIALSAIGVLVFPMLCVAVAAMRAIDRVVLSQFFYGALQSLILAGLLALLVVLHLAASATGIVTLYIVSIVATSLGACLIVWRAARGWPHPAADASVRFGIADSAPIGLAVSIHLLTAWLAYALIASMLGLVEVGALRVCMQIITVITLIFTTFDSVVSPQFAGDFHGGDLAGARRRHWRSIAILAAFAGPPILLCLLFPTAILSIFGPEFLVGARALQVLALGQAVNVLTGPVGTILIMAKRERMNLILAALGLALTLVLLVVLTPRFGLTGAAVATTSAVVFRNIASFVIAWRLTARR